MASFDPLIVEKQYQDGIDIYQDVFLILSALKNILKSNFMAAALPIMICAYPNIDVWCIFYAFTYQLIFDISNQYIGYKQDLINHSNRLIHYISESNLIFVKIVYYIWCAVIIFYETFITNEFILTYWVLICFLHNDMKLSNWWLTKSILIASGVLPMGMIVKLYTPINLTKLVVLTIRMIITCSVQDLKDIDGDIDRLTMPQLFGAKTFLYLYYIPIEIIMTFTTDYYISDRLFTNVLIKIIIIIPLTINIKNRLGYDIYIAYYLYLLYLIKI